MKNSLRWLVLLLFCVLPIFALAVPVGEVTSASERIGIRDVPDWGDTPGKIHRRYCAERTTVPAVWAAVLTPNGIKSDRRMPAGEMLEVKCRELRSAWKTATFFDDGAKQLREEVKKLSLEMTALRGAVNALSTDVSATRTTVHTFVTSHPWDTRPVWWQDYRFWTTLLLLAILGVLIALFLGFLGLIPSRWTATERRTATPVRASSTERTRRAPQSDSVAGIRQVNSATAEVIVAVRDSLGALHLFSYQARIGPKGEYPLLRADESGQPLHRPYGDQFAKDVCESLERYVLEAGFPPHSAERRLISDALSEGRLVDLTRA